MKEFLSGAIIFLLGSLAGGFLFSSEKEIVTTVTEIEERVDTVVIEKPAETRYETLRETILVELRDTVTERDTLFVRLPLEKREYKRDDFYAEVTGVEPRLTYIEVYPKTKIVTKTERVTPKWRFAAFVGLDYKKGKDLYILPNIGAEIAWKRLSAHAEVGIMINEAVEPYFAIGMRYDMIHR